MWVNSPCNQQCKLNNEKICIGCERTLYEIINWSKLSDEEKAEINKRLKK